MPRPVSALLTRLCLDGVLPCALAALALTMASGWYQWRGVDDVLRMRIALQLDQLSDALQRSDGSTTQRLLDEALRQGHAEGLRRIDLREGDRRAWHSGTTDASTNEHHPLEWTTGDTRRRLTMHVDPQVRVHAQRRVWLFAGANALGIALLALLAGYAMHYRAVRPLRRLQQSLERAAEGAPETTRTAEAHREFEQLQAGVATLAGLIRTQRNERAAIQRATAIDALDQMRQSQAASRTKSQFLALVGHHFRQPLQALQLLTASLHPGIDAEQQALLLQMRGSIATMTRLLDALLEISRLDAGVVTTSTAKFSVAELFLRDRNELLNEARAHQVDLRWHANPRQLQGDMQLTAALLRQLISNAITFTPAHGRVLVAARWRSDRVRFEVRDSGSGIAAIQQQRIFEEFVQLHGEDERAHGYGLGLSIAARLGRVLGTRIELHSEPGRGSTFWFELPCPPLGEPLAGSTPLRRLSVAR